jgi:hypothetical protein
VALQEALRGHNRRCAGARATDVNLEAVRESRRIEQIQLGASVIDEPPPVGAQVPRVVVRVAQEIYPGVHEYTLP